MKKLRCIGNLCTRLYYIIVGIHSNAHTGYLPTTFNLYSLQLRLERFFSKKTKTVFKYAFFLMVELLSRSIKTHVKNYSPLLYMIIKNSSSRLKIGLNPESVTIFITVYGLNVKYFAILSTGN